MYHTGLRYTALAATIALGASACAVPHNNVLVFGTDTSFGVGVDIAPDPSSPVGVNIGYKRKEAVWMPLVVNNQTCEKGSGANDSSISCTTNTRSDGELEPDVGNGAKPAKNTKPAKDGSSKYKGRARGINPDRGGNEYEEDTYSVFASFGGNAKGGKDGAQLAVAQFFATGIAAQRLGANPSAAQLVSVQDPGTKALEQAEKRAANAESAQEKTQELLDVSGMSEQDILNKLKSGEDLANKHLAQVKLILLHILPSGGELGAAEKTKLEVLTKAAEATMATDHGATPSSTQQLEARTLSKDNERILKAVDREALERELKESNSLSVRKLFGEIYQAKGES